MIVKREVLDEFLRESSKLLRFKALNDIIDSLVASYVSKVEFTSFCTKDSKIVSRILLEQAKNYYFSDNASKRISFTVNKTNYIVNCNSYGNEYNYIVHYGN